MFAVPLFISPRTQLSVFSAIKEDSQVRYSIAALYPGSSQPILFPGLPLSKRDFAFVLGEFFMVLVGPCLQPVKATLDGSLLSTLSAVHSILVFSENLRRLHSHFFKIIVLNRAGTRADPCSSTLFSTSR